MRAPEIERHESDRAGGLPHPRDAVRLEGHRAAEQAMLESHRAGRLSHAWLIGGPHGIGKATLAWRFARFVLAYPDPGSPEVVAARDLSVPPDHPVWRRLQAGAVGDVAVLRREWNDKTRKFFGEIRVDDVRDALRLFQRAAGAGGYRICILDSAEDLNRSSANALLKAIEEPPPRSLFLVVSHRPTQVMPTILSRCRKLFLSGLTQAEVRAAVLATGAIDPDRTDADLDAVAARSGGSVGRALAMLNETRLALDRDLRAELARLPEVDWKSLHGLADRLGSAEAVETGTGFVDTVLDWIDERIQAGARAAVSPARLAPLTEVWEKVRVAAREAEALNLDKRPLLLSVFADLAHASRSAGF